MKKLLIGLCMIPLLFSGCKSSNEVFSFSVNYGKVTPGEITKQNMVILEPENYTHNEVVALKETGANAVGYVSLGEVNTGRWYYSLLKDRGFLGKNKNWNSYYINLKDSVSRNILLDQVIPNIIMKGFDGLFLDTIDDVAPYTSRAYLAPYMAELINQIRKRYPNIIIIQNAGLFLLDKTHTKVNGVLIEDVASSYNLSNKTYNLSPQTIYKNKVDEIQKYKHEYHLPFYIVDYSNTDKLDKEIIDRLDTLHVPFFISNINLN